MSLLAFKQSLRAIAISTGSITVYIRAVMWIRMSSCVVRVPKQCRRSFITTSTPQQSKMELEDDFLYHFTPLLLVSGLGGAPCLQSHPLQKAGEPLAVRPKGIDHPVAHDLHGRLSAKSNDHKLYEHLAPKASKKKINHLLNVRFIDDAYKLAPVKQNEQYPNGQLHSPLSPLNPESELFPDGLLSVEWVQKYLYLQPGMVVSFHMLGDTSMDDQLIKDLGQLKAQWNKRDIKFVAVVIGETSVSEERIVNLRRSTGLEKRTGLLFVPTSSSPLEKETFVETICQQAYSQGLEYYTALNKKIKKKRGSQHMLTTTDNTSSTAIPLPSAGWEARYSFKMAALSEFRQDLDSALKDYDTAYENMIELLENTKDETRWLQSLKIVDTLCYKMCKICLYMDQPNVAYRKFGHHLKSILKQLDSTKSFDKDMWQAKQYLRLARIVELTDDITIDKSAPLASAPDQYSVRLPRCGFLYLRAVELMRESDGFDIEGPIFDALSRALKDFDYDNNHKRSVAYSMYCHGEALMGKEDYVGALKSLHHAADVYKQDGGWGVVLVPILEKIIECAKHTSHTEDLVRAKVDLSVYNGNELKNDETAKDSDYEEGHEIDGDTSPFSAQFAFESPEFHLGLSAKSQLVLNCTRDWQIDELAVELEGLEDVVLTHQDKEGVFFDIDSDSQCDLKFNGDRASTKIYQMHHTPHDLGQASIKCLRAVSTFGPFKYKYTIPVKPHAGTVKWQTPSGKSICKRLTGPHNVQISPRPARIKMTTQNIGSAAAGEILSLKLTIDNQEQETIALDLQGKVATNEGKSIDIEWLCDKDITKGTKQEPGVHEYPFKLQVPTSGATGLTVELSANYTIDTDETVIKDAIALSVPVLKPFRVNFDVAPRPHPDDWQSQFAPQEALVHSPLIHKRWALTASLLFLGETKVVVVGSELDVTSTNPGEAVCSIVEQDTSEHHELSHNKGMKMSYMFDTCRGDKEIRTVAAEAYLKIQWKRVDSDQLNLFHIPVVRLNLPLQEPRVILDVQMLDGGYVKLLYYLENATNHILTYSVSMGSSAVFAFQGAKQRSLRVLPYTRRVLEYVLLPLASSTTAGQWLKVPQLRIHDTYFKRTLVIVAANPALRAEKADLYVRIS